ncbi:FecR domain-containing protein [Bacteroides faecium]|uniref:DUF4974 domain-containing protein n=1 Tax=Bacteroides faecium TaxID=2715212 RepID=A0A6H0KUJ7_9BACE|nr:FecR domain-containing protein [Bacteroides faecium]QIU96859.1 DUF4974 domain-containing protein [Bacteroides faecium]
MNNSDYINESVLLNYFTGELSPEHRKEVEEWIHLSEDNEKIARDIYQLYRAADTLNYMKQIDAPTAFEKVRNKIHKHQKTASWFMWGQRIAACLAIPLLAVSLYLTLKSTPTEYVILKTNPGMVAVTDLPDGSKVWLNSGSSLKYPVKFENDTRSVELNGEAYFSVCKDKSKRFIVTTPFQIQTEVLGTEFNIEAYQKDSVVKTTLVSGSVRLSFLGKDNREQSHVIKPNEEFAYNPKTKETKTEVLYVRTYTAWKDGEVVFRNTPLSEALKILSKRFNAEFIVKDSTLYNSSFTGVFDSQHLPLILEHFRLAAEIQYKFLEPKKGQDESIEKKTRIELY